MAKPDITKSRERRQVVALGELLRRARRGRYTVEELAARAGVSAGLISQIERGHGNPSFATLLKLTRALEVPVERFFQAASPARRIQVKPSERMKLELPLEGGEGLVYELLTPGMHHSFGFTRAQIPSGWDNEQQPFSRAGEESVHLLDGKLEACIGGQHFFLEAGDTITYDSSVPHWWRNSARQPAHIITAMVHPHFGDGGVRRRVRRPAAARSKRR